MTLPRIFVQITSYRDRECQWTVRDLFERAKHPERVFVGICWQTVPEEDADCFTIEPRPDQVRTVHVHAEDARGLGWARAQAQALWHGEEYTLQIDSHMRFVDDWDQRMLDMLGACPSDDPVLTHYPGSYYPPEKTLPYGAPYVQMVRKFLSNGMPLFGVERVPKGTDVTAPLPTAAVAGGFIFGSSRMVTDVPSDPDIYFTGEEPNLAVRLWTHGFDLFSPHEDLLFHYYYRRDSNKHWTDHKERTLRSRQALTKRRMRLLCAPGEFSAGEVAALGPFGLGPRRSLAAYESFSGLDLTACTIAPDVCAYPWVRPHGRMLPDLAETLRPTPGTELFVMGDDGVLFGEKTGTLHRLNAAATIVWCGRDAGWSWDQLAAKAVSDRAITQKAARTELKAIVDRWLGENLLVDEAASPITGVRLDRFTFRHRDYRLLDSIVRVRFADPALEAHVHTAFAHLEGGGASPITELTVIRILDWIYIIADGKVLMLDESTAKLVPRLKAEIMARAIRNQAHLVHVHGAAVTRHGRLLILPAPSGSGKTTLTARLLAAGWGYFSDEAVLFRPVDGAVRPIPTALSVKEGSLDVLRPLFPELEGLAMHEREDGVPVRYLPPPRANRVAAQAAALPAIIVFPDSWRARLPGWNG